VNRKKTYLQQNQSWLISLKEMRSSSLAEELLCCWIIPAIAREKTQAMKGYKPTAKCSEHDLLKQDATHPS
jgi:hypothetical protein